MDYPKRRHTLSLKIDGDSPEEIARALDQFSLAIRGAGRESPILRDEGDAGKFDGISAGWSWSWLYEHEFRPEQTGDNYRAELEAWRVRNLENKPA